MPLREDNQDLMYIKSLELFLQNGKLDGSLSFLLRLLRKKYSLDVGEDTSLCDSDSTQQLVQLLIIPDGQLKMSRDDPGLLVVPGSITSQLKNLSCKILHDSSHVHRGASTNTLSVVTFTKQTMNTSHRELQTSTARPRLGLSLHFSSFTTTRHDAKSVLVDA